MKPHDTRTDRDQRLADVKERVLFHAHPTPRPRFSESRWPYTYAADFVRAHEAIIPDVVWDRLEVSGGVSRSQASHARQIWANSLSLEDHDVAELLACGYIIENNFDVDWPAARRLVPTWALARIKRLDPDAG